MMRLYYMAGDRTLAMRQYERCISALREELGIGPSDRTIELFEQIKTDRHSRHPKADAREEPQSANTVLANTIKRLDQYAATLTLVQSQIQDEIINLENRLQTGQ